MEPTAAPTETVKATAGPEKVPAGHTRVRLTISYDGTNYAGWQLQKIGTGVQELIERALGRLFKPTPRLHSSSRTDTGVHALALVAHLDIPKDQFRMTCQKLVLAINAHLPDDIRVTAASKAPPGFHARFRARGKQYRYSIWNHRAMNPLLRTQAWHVTRPLDLRTMRAAAARLLGYHDFRALAANRGYPFTTTHRTLTKCQIQKRRERLTVIIEADGFLYRMCRGIVGTLVQVGLGQLRPEDIDQILLSRDRRKAGVSAPAHGLVLWKVFYPRRAAAAPADADAEE